MTTATVPIDYADIAAGDIVTVISRDGHTATGQAWIDDMGNPRILYDLINAADSATGGIRYVEAHRTVSLDDLPDGTVGLFARDFAPTFAVAVRSHDDRGALWSTPNAGGGFTEFRNHSRELVRILHLPGGAS